MTTETQPLRGPLRQRQSNLWRRDPLDWYVEPEWCSERLFELVRPQSPVWDPAAGMGRIVASAQKADLEAYGSDINPHHDSVVKWDFFNTSGQRFWSIVSNPPFGKAREFAARALELGNFVILLLPANWIQGDKRSRWLETTPLREVLFISPRPSMPPGSVVLAGEKPGNGTTDYAWFVWEHGHQGAPAIGWCRK